MSSRKTLFSPFLPRFSALALGAALVAAVALPPLHAKNNDMDFDDYFEISKNPWTFAIGGNGGLNKLGNGYEGYDDMPHGGADFYIRPPRPQHEDPTFKDKFMLRFSADYFPLQVPEGVYGLTEDIYALSMSVIVRLRDMGRPDHQMWVPFLGLGAGFYRDQIELDTPASGKISDSHNYFGLNFSGGFFFPEVLGIRFAPEVRYHMLRTPGNFSATNICYMMGASIRFGDDE